MAVREKEAKMDIFAVPPPSVVSAIRRGEWREVHMVRVFVRDHESDPLGVPSGHWENVPVEQIKNQMDIFAVGTDGGVYTNWVVDHDPWNRWIRIVDSGFWDNFTVPPQSVVTAIKRDEHQMDIFAIARGGEVFTNWVVDHRPWNVWIRIADPSFGDGFTVPLQSVVTAVKRDEHQVDIFAVGKDGGVYTNWVVDHDPWNVWIRIADPNFGDGFTVPPPSVVTAIKRDEHHMDIFAVGRGGEVFTNWVVDHGHWNQWIRIADPNFGDGFTVPPQTVVTAVKRDEHQLDIFAVGKDGGVYTNWVVDHNPWNQWIRIADPNFGDGFTVPLLSTVAAVKRDDDFEDVFAVGKDGGVYTNWVVEHGPWNQWIRLR
jgi:hypothetical protein